MTVAFITLILTIFFAVFVYRRPRFERKLLKKIPLVDWLNLLVLPAVVYFALVSIVKAIILRPRYSMLDFEDVSIISLLVCFLLLTFIGNTIHFCGKVLSRYIHINPQDIVYQVNEIFHDKLSHYMTFMGCLVTFFLIGILEINYPAQLMMRDNQYAALLSMGIIGGAAATKGVFTWQGRNYRPISWLNFILLVTQITLFLSYDLSYRYYQYNTFLLSFMVTALAMFSSRTIMILTKLDAAHRMRYLAKLLSLR
jgi:hypothetical protein